MAIDKNRKHEIVAELSELLSTSKMTVFAQYSELSVKDIQELRKLAKESNTKLRVVKNRLVKVALDKTQSLRVSDATPLKGQLMYAFNAQDEVAPAKALAQFAKTHPSLALKGAIDISGRTLTEDAVKQLADLPTKEQLRAQVVGSIGAPLSGLVGVLSGNIRGLVTVLNGRARKLEIN